jgi:hypothetical protein
MDVAETLTQNTARFLRGAGYMRNRMEYPRWAGRKYTAREFLRIWHYTKEFHLENRKRQALLTLAIQPFTGIRAEWIDSEM